MNTEKRYDINYIHAHDTIKHLNSIPMVNYLRPMPVTSDNPAGLQMIEDIAAAYDITIEPELVPFLIDVLGAGIIIGVRKERNRRTGTREA